MKLQFTLLVLILSKWITYGQTINLDISHNLTERSFIQHTIVNGKKFGQKYFIKDGYVTEYWDLKGKRPIIKHFISRDSLNRITQISKWNLKEKVGEISYGYKSIEENVLSRIKSGYIKQFKHYSNDGELLKDSLIFDYENRFVTDAIIKYYNEGKMVKRVSQDFFEDGTKQTLIEKHSYDKFGNIIKIERSSIPEQEYPLLYAGGPEKHRVELYQYEYNSKNEWVVKYLVYEGELSLIATREYQ